MISLKSFKLYDKDSGLTSFGASISLAAFLLGAAGTALNGSEYVKNRPKPLPVLPLESDAIDAGKYGRNYKNEDRDHNGARETYFKDPVTGIEYQVRLDPQTREFTLTQTRKR